MAERKHVPCPICSRDCDARLAAIIGLPCGHTHHAQCVVDQRGNWSIPFCEATEACFQATIRTKAIQQVERIRLEGAVQVIPEKAVHNWLPPAILQHMDVERGEQDRSCSRSSFLRRCVTALVRPLLAYAALEGSLSTHGDGDILRQLDAGAPLNQLRGRNNRRIDSLYLLTQSMPECSRGDFFASLGRNTKFAEISALRAATEDGVHLLNLLKALGFTTHCIGCFGRIAEFAHAFDIEYRLFYAEVCGGSMRTLESLRLDEKDFKALATRARDIVASTGFEAGDIEHLRLTMDTWKRLGATVELFRGIPLSARDALLHWGAFYTGPQACEHAFQQNFGVAMSALDVAATAATPATGAVGDAPLGRRRPAALAQQSPLAPLAATASATGGTTG